MDLFDRVDEIIAYVEDARAIPMSGSCVVHRGDLLGLLDELREDLPAEVRRARALLERRDEVLGTAEQEAGQQVAGARQEAERTVTNARREAERAVSGAQRDAERILAAAETETHRLLDAAEQARAHLVAEAEVTVAAEAEAARIRREAGAEAARMRQEVDAYVEARLASIEQLLHRTLQAVERGRSRLRERGDAGLEPGLGSGPESGIEPDMEREGVRARSADRR